jgi:deoxyinosine 3'endonuclease (endonuclease V)
MQAEVRARLFEAAKHVERIVWEDVKVVGGTDVSFVKDSDEACACIALLSFPDLALLGCVQQRVRMHAPYVSGYLAFREADPLSALLNHVREGRARPGDADGEVQVTAGPAWRGRADEALPAPDVVLVDGNGLLHPRRAGLATHLGVLSRWRTVGVGKNLPAVGALTREGVEAQCQAALARGETVVGLRAVSDDMAEAGEADEALLGVALMTDGKRPVFVSIGSGICLDDAVELVRRCSRYRIPEPIRAADQASRALLRAADADGAS